MTDGVGPGRPQKQSKRLLTVTFLFRLKPFSVMRIRGKMQEARCGIPYVDSVIDMLVTGEEPPEEPARRRECVQGWGTRTEKVFEPPAF